MRRFISGLIFVFMVLAFASPSHAWVRAFHFLTGDVTGSIDNVPCDAEGLATSDGAGIVFTESGSVYFYYFDRSATFATSSPTYIRCKNYSTSGVWINKTDIYALLAHPNFLIGSDGSVNLASGSSSIGFPATSSTCDDNMAGKYVVTPVSLDLAMALARGYILQEAGLSA